MALAPRLGAEDVLQLLAGHAAGGYARQRPADGLRDERYRAGGARVDLDHPHFAVLDCKLDVHEPDDVQAFREGARDAIYLVDRLLRQRDGRRHRRRVAGVAAGRLDVLEYRADHGLVPVADAVDVQLGRMRQELVDQDRPALGYPDGLLHVLPQGDLVVYYRHAASAEDEAGPYEDGVADLPCDVQRVRNRMGDTAGRLLHPDLLDEAAEEVAVLRERYVPGRSPEDLHPGGFQPFGEVQGGLSPELDDGAFAALAFVDLHYVFERERLEVEAVRGVVVGRDGLGVRVDHDDFESAPAQRERRMAAAPVELYSLSDAVRPAAEDHYLPLAAAVSGGLSGVSGRIRGVAAVVVRRGGLELAGAGVHFREDGANAERDAAPAHRALVGAYCLRDLPVAEAEDLGLAQDLRREAGRLGRVGRGGQRHEGAELVDFVQLAPEPRVEGARVVPGKWRLKGAHGLQVRLLEGAADGHGFADGLHLRAESRVRSGELLESESRHLHHHVVERRLEARRRNPRDVVGEFVQRVAHGEKRGDLRDREPSRLGGEGGRARHARVHLDDNPPPVLRVDRPLHVRSARGDAYRLEDPDGVVAHRLVFAVGQRLYRRDRDRVAGVHAHRVHVLDGADDDGVPRLVAHHLHLEFLPADQGLLYEDFAVQRRGEPARDDFAEFPGVVRNAAARSAEGEAGTYYQRPSADFARDALGLRKGVRAP